MNKKYTVLLLLPDYLCEESIPWVNTYLSYVTANSTESAIEFAQENAYDVMPDAENAEDFAVLFACEGHQKDLYDGRA